MISTHPLLKRLGIEVPIIQAPMAGVSTPELAAAVSNAGALGSIAIGAGTLNQARDALNKTRALTTRPFNVNLFWVRDCSDEVTLLHERVLPGGAVYIFFEATRPDQVAEIVEKTSAALSSAGFRVSVVQRKVPACVGIIGRR